MEIFSYNVPELNKFMNILYDCDLWIAKNLYLQMVDLYMTWSNENVEIYNVITSSTNVKKR